MHPYIFIAPFRAASQRGALKGRINQKTEEQKATFLCLLNSKTRFKKKRERGPEAED